jgi:type I restriction enzyme R subunit
MRDHTLLQAIARVNRPYENEEADIRKPHGFVLDFVGIFDKLEKALAFDSDEVDAVVKDLSLLKQLFKAKMESKAPPYLDLVQGSFDDKDVDNLIEFFRDKPRRAEFFKEFKELEMLYEIISPDAFLRPYLEEYASLAAMYEVVRNAYTRRVYVDREVQRKTDKLVQEHIGAYDVSMVTDFVAINETAIALIKDAHGGEATRVINLIKSIEKKAEEESGDPFLIAMADRAKAIQEGFEERQISTQEAIDSLLVEIDEDRTRQKVQAERNLDDITAFILTRLTDAGVENAEAAARKAGQAFVDVPHWRTSESDLREARKRVTFALYPVIDDADDLTELVQDIFNVLQQTRAN